MLSLPVLGDRQPADQCRADERIARDVLPGGLWHLALGDRHRAKSIVAEHARGLGLQAQHKDGVRLPADILACLSLR